MSMKHFASGASGKVYLLEEGDRKFAVKGMELNPRAKKEVRIHRDFCNHPHVVSLRGVAMRNDHLYLKMDYHPYTLLDIIRDCPNGRLSESKCRQYMKQLASVLHHIHEKGIVHKDVKLENVLVSENKQSLYLTDFGFSTEWSAKKSLKDHLGSLHYSSPEIWNGRKYTGPEVDVWSLGVTLFLLATGYFPFGGETSNEIYKNVEDHDLWFPSHVSRSLRRLLKGMLAYHPSKRLSMSEVKKHAWFSRSRGSTLSKMSTATSSSDSLSITLEPSPETHTTVEHEKVHTEEGVVPKLNLLALQEEAASQPKSQRSSRWRSNSVGSARDHY